VYINSLSLGRKNRSIVYAYGFYRKDSLHIYQTLELVEEQKVGGLIFSLGGPVAQSHWLNKFQAQAKTPLLIAMDAEWGVAMRLDSVQAFPLANDLRSSKGFFITKKNRAAYGRTRKTTWNSL